MNTNPNSTHRNEGGKVEGAEMDSLPLSPNEMPSDWHNSPNQVRNCVVTLDQYSYVDLHWEHNHEASEATGENVGEWEVVIEDGPRRFRAKHPEITNALWFVTKLADSANTAAYDAQQKARAEALSKLTTDERRMLGI